MKKPSLASVAMSSKSSDEPDMDDEGYDAAVDELADVLNVPDEKREAFREAFRAAAMSCG